MSLTAPFIYLTVTPHPYNTMVWFSLSKKRHTEPKVLSTSLHSVHPCTRRGATILTCLPMTGYFLPFVMGCIRHCHRGTRQPHTVLKLCSHIWPAFFWSQCTQGWPCQNYWKGDRVSKKELKVKKKKLGGKGEQEGERSRNDLENISRIWKQMYDIWSVHDPFVALVLLNTAWWRKYLAGTVSFI